MQKKRKEKKRKEKKRKEKKRKEKKRKEKKRKEKKRKEKKRKEKKRKEKKRSYLVLMPVTLQKQNIELLKKTFTHTQFQKNKFFRHYDIPRNDKQTNRARLHINTNRNLELKPFWHTTLQ